VRIGWSSVRAAAKAPVFVQLLAVYTASIGNIRLAVHVLHVI